MRYVPHSYLPVPEEVIERQAAIRSARDRTKVMYGSTGPYLLGTPEYEFFVNIMFDMEPMYA